jgi:ABC-type transport system involved in multi-copper enzyme maturation permease subunit
VNRMVMGETFRRHVTSAAFLSFLAFLTIVTIGLAQFDRPAAGWPGLIVLLAIVTGAGLIGPELSSGRLQLILVKPVSRSAYLLSRTAGVVLVVWAAAMLAAVCELAGRAFGYAAEVGAALLNVMYEVVLIVALLALLGSLTRAYYNVVLYLGLQILLAMAGGLGQKLPPAVARALAAVDRNLFPERPPALDAQWFLLIGCNAAIALVLACLVFRRREVPYGAE